MAENLPRNVIMESGTAAAKRRTERKSKAKISTLVCPPEKHISVDMAELKAAIKNRLDLADRANFDELTKLAQGVAQFDFYDLKQRISANFLPFSSGAKHQVYLQRNSKSLPTTASLDKKEEEFIADVYEVLRASHYHLLTKNEWNLATAEEFELNFPTTVNWEYMDVEMLTKFWVSTPERAALREELPDEMADRILVFHRGVGTQKLSGLLIDQKLDLLMDYTVFYLLDLVTSLLPKRNTAPKKTPAQLEAEKLRAQMAGLASEANPSQSLSTPSMHGGKVTGNQWVGSTHKYAKVVERQTLQRQCPTLLSLLKAFPVPLELQEPSFKDLVVLYRRALPQRKPPSSKNKLTTKSKEERMQGILNYRNIYIKIFGEIPMADVEMIFPDKKLGIKPFALVNLAVTVGTALFAGGAMLLKPGQQLDSNVLWTAASLVLTRCFQVYSSAQQQKATAQQNMSATLYDKMQDSQEGVVSVIMEEMASQQFKQMLCAYMLLVLKGKAMSLTELDDTIEDFLVRDFDHKIDFQVEDALPRLLRWGLVTRTPAGKLQALPMVDAISTLKSAWSTAYTALGTATGSTKDMITGQGSAFGAGLDAYHANRALAAQEAAAAVEAEASKKKGFSRLVHGMGKDKDKDKASSRSRQPSPAGSHSANVPPSSSANTHAPSAAPAPAPAATSTAAAAAAAPAALANSSTSPSHNSAAAPAELAASRSLTSSGSLTDAAAPEKKKPKSFLSKIGKALK